MSSIIVDLPFIPLENYLFIIGEVFTTYTTVIFESVLCCKYTSMEVARKVTLILILYILPNSSQGKATKMCLKN